MFNQCCSEEEGRKISKWIVVTLVFLSLFLLTQVLAGFEKLPNIGKEVYPQSTIVVSGSGEAYAIPDIATFNFSVTELGSTVKQAQEKADTKINKALTAVRESGIEDKDIKTTGYNVYPKYEWNKFKNILTGYEVSQNITVKVRDTEKVGDLVTKIGAVGVSNISGVEFTVDNRDQYVAQAREEAIAKAKAKAKELAKELGVKLGDILYYSENGNYPIYYGAVGKGGSADMMTTSAVPAAELPTGETKITSDVSITYEIK